MAVAKNEEEEIVICGEVIEILAVSGEHPHLKWLVKLKIEKVNSGHFEGKIFSFAIHSPTKAGIAVGGRYVLHLSHIEGGRYLVKNVEKLPL